VSAAAAAAAQDVQRRDCSGNGDNVPSPEYLRLVSQYASGNHADAVAALGQWSQERLKCDLDELRTAAQRAQRCDNCPARLVFERFSVRAAILLHADREALEEMRPPVAEQPPSCGTGPHAGAVERLTALLLLVDPSPGDFLRRFHLAMARHAHRCHCLHEAKQWARAGLKLFPRDAPLLLALGITTETEAFHTRALAPVRAGLSSRAAAQHAADTAALRNLWESARDAFEEAIAAAPELYEARLRLGRVLLRLDKPEASQQQLEIVLSESREPSERYLAHLFLGRIHEKKQRLGEAAAEYRAALALRASSEPAAVALSHVQLLHGDPESAREVLSRALQHSGRRSDLDPYVEYDMAHTAEGERMLHELRRELRR
jgi:tetratricopeptide (TPR) repeat protein